MGNEKGELSIYFLKREVLQPMACSCSLAVPVMHVLPWKMYHESAKKHFMVAKNREVLVWRPAWVCTGPPCRSERPWELLTVSLPPGSGSGGGEVG